MGRLGDIENALAELDRKIEAYKPVSGSGTSVTDVAGGSGRAINLPLTPPAKADATGQQPFLLIDATDISGNNIRVVYGTVNGVVPDGMSPGDNPTYVLTGVADATGYVWLIVTTDDSYIINDVSIDFGATVPTDDETTKTYYLQIGSFAINSSVLSLAQSISGSQGFKWCGSPVFALS